MSPKAMTTIRLKPDLLEAMRSVKEREGIPMAAQVDFAVRDWLKRRGLEIKATPRRAQTRRKV